MASSTIYPDVHLRPHRRDADLSTINCESQDERDESGYQRCWSNVMSKGKYRSSSDYKDIKVLLLCWAESCDDLTTKQEVHDLKSVFEDQFNYHVQIERLSIIPGKRLQVGLNATVAKFVNDHDGPNALLIVYYAGHGRPGKYHGALELFGQISQNDLKNIRKVSDNCDTLVWNKTEEVLRDAQADVLEIFDCCYAGNLGLTRGEQRLFEYLAATKELDLTPVPGKNSFTSALIFALKALVVEKTNGRFTTVELRNKIKSHTDFPPEQIPVLSEREKDTPPGRIMLHPLSKTGVDGQLSPCSPGPDPSKGHAITLIFDFNEKPSLDDIHKLGGEFNDVFERNTFGVDRIRWGGVKPTTLAQSVKSFQAILKRNRSASFSKRQAAENLEVPERRRSFNSPDSLTPPSTNRASPQVREQEPCLIIPADLGSISLLESVDLLK